MALTPGVLYFLAIAPNVLFPLCIHIVLLYLANTYHLFHLSRTVVVLVWIFTLPVYWYIKANYKHAVNARQARRVGAKLAPAAQAELPGNIDLLWKFFFGRDLYLGDGFARAIDENGTTFSLTILGDYRLVTANPHNIKQVLAADFDNFEKGEQISQMTGSVLGVGVFNSDGDMWQFHRKITRPFFAKERVIDFSIFETKSSVAHRKMQERFDTGDAIDFQDLCGRFTIDSACAFLLGTSVDSLQDPLPRLGADFSHIDTPSNKFLRAFADAQTSIATRARIGPSWPLLEIFEERTRKDMKVVRGFIEPIVREAMRKREESSVNEKEDSLLQHLLNVTQDLNLIVDETLNVILAGRDTTAGLLTFVAYCLAMHPEVLARLRNEIITTVGTSRAPTYEDVRGMKYLRAVLNETLRLFPSVPWSSRYSITPTTLHDDDGQEIYVPARTRVIYSFMHAQRHKAYWGEDAHLFDPDRFLDDRVKKYVTPNPFVFVPFNAGPRICLGQQFAYQEASFFIIRMLQRFDGITLAPESQPEYSKPPASWRNSQRGGTPRKAFEQIVPHSHLTLFVEGGLWLRMRPCKPIEEA